MSWLLRSLLCVMSIFVGSKGGLPQGKCKIPLPQMPCTARKEACGTLQPSALVPLTPPPPPSPALGNHEPSFCWALGSMACFPRSDTLSWEQSARWARTAGSGLWSSGLASPSRNVCPRCQGGGGPRALRARWSLHPTSRGQKEEGSPQLPPVLARDLASTTGSWARLRNADIPPLLEEGPPTGCRGWRAGAPPSQRRYSGVEPQPRRAEVRSPSHWSKSRDQQA